MADIERIGNLIKKLNFSEENFQRTDIENFNLPKGSLIVLSSRSSRLNSVFALSYLKYLSVNKDIPVGYISCGAMDSNTIGQRLISMESKVSYLRIRSGLMNKVDVNKIHAGTERMDEAPFYIYDNPNTCFEYLIPEVYIMIDEKKIQLIVIDSFEYMEEVVDAKEEEYRSRIEYLLTEFKELAKDLNIPIIMLMELPHSEDNLKLGIEDFKKYMIIPRTADMVMFVNRNQSEINEENHEYNLYIAKDVNGRSYHITLEFSEKTDSFVF